MPEGSEQNKMILKEKINDFCDENELYCVFNDIDDDFDTLIKCFSSKCFESGLRTKGGRGNYPTCNPQSDYDKYNFNPTSIHGDFDSSIYYSGRNSKRVIDNTETSGFQVASEIMRNNNFTNNLTGMTPGVISIKS